MTKIALIGIIIVGAAVMAEKALEIPVARLTLRAVDEQGKPVKDAAVKIGFEERIPKWGGGNVVW